MSAAEGSPGPQPPPSAGPQEPPPPALPALGGQPPGRRPPRVTEGPEIGLPPGVAIADLGPRLLAWLIEASVPLVLLVLLLGAGPVGEPGTPAGLTVVVLLLDLGWFVVVWRGYATQAAGPGAKLVGLQLVGMSDGRPVGWGRFLLRALVFALAAVFVPVLIGILVILVRNPRRQGWHDLAVGSVLIKARALAPRPAKASEPSSRRAAPVIADQAGQPGASEPTVGLPASSGPAPAGGSGPGVPTAHYGPVSRYGAPSPSSAASPTTGSGSAVPPAGPTGPPSGAYPPPLGPSRTATHDPSEQQSGDPAGPLRVDQPWPPPTTDRPGGQPPEPDQPVVHHPTVTPPPPTAPPAPPPSRARAQEDDAVDAAPPAGAVPTVDRPSAAPGPAPVAPAPGGVGRSVWRVRLDGRTITVDRLVLLGRNPQRGPGEETAEIVRVKDEARTISKTHVAIGVDDRGLFVVDRGSTNGSAVTSPDGVYRLLQAGQPVRLDVGWVVAFGAHELTVDRA